MKQHLPMTPSRAFARIMELTNGGAYRAALDAIGLPAEGSLLEIGFGSGRLLALARKRWPAARLAGVDPTPAMVDMASGRSGLQNGALPELHCRDASSLPWNDSSFDAVVCVHAFQFWNPPAQSATEACRVLKPGGRLVLVLRDHTRHAPDWLPNPISRLGAEANGAARLLEATGLGAVHVQQVGQSTVLVASALD